MLERLAYCTGDGQQFSKYFSFQTELSFFNRIQKLPEICILNKKKQKQKKKNKKTYAQYHETLNIILAESHLKPSTM